MLAPSYVQKVSEGAEKIAEELHQNIIKRIVQRVMLRLGRGENYLLTAQDKWQLETLVQAGYLMTDLQNEIAIKTKQQQKEIQSAFEDAGVTALQYDDAVYKAVGLSPLSLTKDPYMIRLMQRAYKATQAEWLNFTRTTANAAQQLFIRECDKAYNLVAGGAVSYTQAVKEAVETISQSGVIVTYPSGHADTIETATLRAVRTGIAQATGDITMARMNEMDWDIVLVSAHLGARVGSGAADLTNHAWWQGKFYSRSGQDKRFPPFSVCGLGDVQGILGANCRHSFGPGDGEHNPFEKFDSEENERIYKLEQKQRAMERKIRKTKREVMGLKAAVDAAQDDKLKAELSDSYGKKAAVLQRQNAQYKQFCADNGLRPLQDRLKTAQWDRKQAASATAAARLQKKDNDGTIYADSVISEFIRNAKAFGATTPKRIYDDFLANGVNVLPLNVGKLKGIEFTDGGGYRVVGTKDGQYLQYHPDVGSHHGGAYYKLASGEFGRKRYNMNGDEIK